MVRSREHLEIVVERVLNASEGLRRTRGCGSLLEDSQIRRKAPIVRRSKLEELSCRPLVSVPAPTGSGGAKAWMLDELAIQELKLPRSSDDARKELLDMLAGSYRSQRMVWDTDPSSV